MAERKDFEKKIIIDPKKLKEKIISLRKEKKSIATLNGSFDIFHKGHLEIIFEASKQKDVLIVALTGTAAMQLMPLLKEAEHLLITFWLMRGLAASCIKTPKQRSSTARSPL